MIRRRGDMETRRRGEKRLGDAETRFRVFCLRVSVSQCLRVFCLRVPVSPCLRVFFVLAALCAPAFAQPGQPGPSSPLYGARPEIGATSSGLPKALQDVSFDQKLNAQLPLDLVFRNENGETVRLGDYLGKKPIVLSLVYYECPMLCTQVLNGMVSAFRVLSFKPGQEFDVIMVSFDPREKPALAAAKKKNLRQLPAGIKAGLCCAWLAFPDGRPGEY